MGNDRFSDALLQRIKDAVPISDVIGSYVVWDKSKSTSGDHWACCPFHNEADPSFHALDKEGFYKCFVCDGVSGDHFNFLQQHLGIDFVEAVKIVAELAGVDLPDNRPSPPRSPAPPVAEEPVPKEKWAPKGRWTIFKTYDYADGDGTLIYQNVRIQWKLPDGSWELDPKTGKAAKDFRQRRPSGLPDGSWVWGLRAGEFMRRRDGDDWRKFDEVIAAEWGGAQRLSIAHDTPHGLYRRQQVELAIERGETIFIMEGEKASDAGVGIGCESTTNSGGGENFSDYLVSVFRGAHVVIIPDNDAQARHAKTGALLFHPDGRPRFKGWDHAVLVATKLRKVAASVKILKLPDLPIKGDIVEWLQAGGTKDSLMALVAATPEFTPPQPPSRFGAVRMRDIAGSKIEYDWLIKGLIERGGVFMVAAEKQAGKSFFIIDIGMKVARGLPYHDRIVKQGLVIYMACEDGKGIKLRVEGLRRDLGIPPDQDLPFLIMDPLAKGASTFSLMSDEAVDQFIAECRAWADWYGQKLELIIIDTLSVATEGMDEINGAEVGKVLARVNRIAAQTGAAVGLIHHMNADGKRVRGHSSLGNNVSGVIELRPLAKPQTNRNLPPEWIKDADGRLIRKAVLDKNKNGPNKISWRFVLRQVKLDVDDDGVDITTCVLDTPSSEPDEGGIKTGRLSQDQKLVFEALKDAVTDEGIAMPHGVRVGPQIKVAAPQKAFVRNVRQRMDFKSSADDDRARLAELSAFMKRNVTALINGGYMGRDNDKGIVWLLGKDERAPREAPPPPKSSIPDDVKREIMEEDIPF